MFLYVLMEAVIGGVVLVGLFSFKNLDKRLTHEAFKNKFLLVLAHISGVTSMLEMSSYLAQIVVEK